MALMNFNDTTFESSGISSISNGYSQSTTTVDDGFLSQMKTSSAEVVSTSFTSSFYSNPSSSSTEFSIVEPSTSRLDDNGTDSTAASSQTTLFSSSSSHTFSSISESSVQDSFSASLINSTSIISSLSASSTHSSSIDAFNSVRSSSSGSWFALNTDSALSLAITSSETSVRWNHSSVTRSSRSTTIHRVSATLTSSSSERSNSLSDITSFSQFPSSSSILSSSPTLFSSLSSASTSSSYSSLEQISTGSLLWPTSTSSSDPGFSSSRNSMSIYYIYSQPYEITGSSTTFETELITTTVLDANAGAATSSFSSPKSTITEDLDFYQKWMKANQSGSNKASTQSNKNKIIGGVVGGICGLIACCLIIYFMYWKKRKVNKEKNRSFSSEIGRRAGYPVPISADEVDGEKIAIKNHNSEPIMARIKNRAAKSVISPHVPRRGNSEPEPPAIDSDPFQNEFDFESRKRARPPLPPPRKVVSLHNQDPSSNLPQTLGTVHEEGSLDGRYSFISSMGESSAQGDDSTMSSTSIRLGMHGHVNDPSSSSQGFFREMI